MLSCGGSCAGEKGTPSCHSGSGRPCYHHGHRACPICEISPVSGCLQRCAGFKVKDNREDIILEAGLPGCVYLAWVDFGSAESVVVDTHFDNFAGLLPVRWKEIVLVKL